MHHAGSHGRPILLSCRMPRPFASVGDVLKGLAPRLGLETRLLELHLKQQWERIVGTQIATHARPGRIRFKRLHVLVTSSVWVQQLTFLKPALIQRLNEASGNYAITDLVVRVGDPSEGEAERPRQDQDDATVERASPSEEQLQEAARHVATIQDDELRRQLTTLMATALSLPSPLHAPPNRPDPGRRDQSAP